MGLRNNIRRLPGNGRVQQSSISQRNLQKARGTLRKGLNHFYKLIDHKRRQAHALCQKKCECTDLANEGSMTADPEQIDGIVKRAWQRIEHMQCRRYARGTNAVLLGISSIHSLGPNFQLPGITAEMVMWAFSSAHNVGGMDGWRPLA